MKLLIAIDDTDSIESRGTGEIADLLASGIKEGGWGNCGAVTRHQLLLHPDIPYTSHNSSMCFTAEVPEEALEAVIEYCRTTLAAESELGSDPGLCVVVPDRLMNHDLLMEFGRKAKSVVISKEEAYETAAGLGVHLSEHGGTGQGIIGALAGAGLRLTGNDGRFKGKLRIPSLEGVASVEQILRFGVDEVLTLERKALPADELVSLGDTLKTVLLDGKAVLLVLPLLNSSGAAWKTCDRKVFRDY